MNAGSANFHQNNHIFENGGLGIDLAPDGVNANDHGDVDSGPNGPMNYPVFTRSIIDIWAFAEGFIDSEPNKTIRIYFYVVESCDPSGYGEGWAKSSTGAETSNVKTDNTGIGFFADELSTFSGTSYHYIVVSTKYAEFSECRELVYEKDASLSSIGIADVSLTEGDSGSKWMGFEVNLDHTATVTVSVSYTTGGGSANIREDYMSITGTIRFPSGTVSQTISVEILGDTETEYHETFNVNLSNPIGAIFGDSQAIGTILDDDGGGYPLFIPLILR